MSRCMTLNVPTSTIISADAKGIIEYWDGETLESVSQPDVLFRYKTETDLYELAKVTIYYIATTHSAAL